MSDLTINQLYTLRKKEWGKKYNVIVDEKGKHQFTPGLPDEAYTELSNIELEFADPEKVAAYRRMIETNMINQTKQTTNTVEPQNTNPDKGGMSKTIVKPIDMDEKWKSKNIEDRTKKDFDNYVKAEEEQRKKEQAYRDYSIKNYPQPANNNTTSTTTTTTTPTPPGTSQPVIPQQPQQPPVSQPEITTREIKPKPTTTVSEKHKSFIDKYAGAIMLVSAGFLGYVLYQKYNNPSNKPLINIPTQVSGTVGLGTSGAPIINNAGYGGGSNQPGLLATATKETGETLRSLLKGGTDLLKLVGETTGQGLNKVIKETAEGVKSVAVDSGKKFNKLMDEVARGGDDFDDWKKRTMPILLDKSGTQLKNTLVSLGGYTKQGLTKLGNVLQNVASNLSPKEQPIKEKVEKLRQEVKKEETKVKLVEEIEEIEPTVNEYILEVPKAEPSKLTELWNNIKSKGQIGFIALRNKLEDAGSNIKSFVTTLKERAQEYLKNDNKGAYQILNDQSEELETEYVKVTDDRFGLDEEDATVQHSSLEIDKFEEDQNRQANEISAEIDKELQGVSDVVSAEFQRLWNEYHIKNPNLNIIDKQKAKLKMLRELKEKEKELDEDVSSQLSAGQLPEKQQEKQNLLKDEDSPDNTNIGDTEFSNMLKDQELETAEAKTPDKEERRPKLDDVLTPEQNETPTTPFVNPVPVPLVSPTPELKNKLETIKKDKEKQMEDEINIMLESLDNNERIYYNNVVAFDKSMTTEQKYKYLKNVIEKNEEKQNIMKTPFFKKINENKEPTEEDVKDFVRKFSVMQLISNLPNTISTQLYNILMTLITMNTIMSGVDENQKEEVKEILDEKVGRKLEFDDDDELKKKQEKIRERIRNKLPDMKKKISELKEDSAYIEKGITGWTGDTLLILEELNKQYEEYLRLSNLTNKEVEVAESQIVERLKDEPLDPQVYNQSVEAMKQKYGGRPFYEIHPGLFKPEKLKNDDDLVNVLNKAYFTNTQRTITDEYFKKRLQTFMIEALGQFDQGKNIDYKYKKRVELFIAVILKIIRDNNNELFINLVLTIGGTENYNELEKEEKDKQQKTKINVLDNVETIAKKHIEKKVKRNEEKQKKLGFIEFGTPDEGNLLDEPTPEPEPKPEKKKTVTAVKKIKKTTKKT